MIGKIYKWVTGNYIDTDSCNVRNTVLFKAPIKALFGINLFYISGLDTHVQLWFIWVTVYQVYVLANWQRLVVDQNINTEMFLYPLFPIVFLVSVVEVFLVIVSIGAGIGSVVSKATRPADDIINEWWDEIKNRVCKPVSWIE